MKSQDEIEDLAQEWFDNNVTERWGGEVDGFIAGYNQRQESMVKNMYTVEDMRKAMIAVIVSNAIKTSKDIDDYLNLL